MRGRGNSKKNSRRPPHKPPIIKETKKIGTSRSIKTKSPVITVPKAKTITVTPKASHRQPVVTVQKASPKKPVVMVQKASPQKNSNSESKRGNKKI